MSARLGFADHLKLKGISEDANAYIDLGINVGESTLRAIC
jgi:hypothetical protein